MLSSPTPPLRWHAPNPYPKTRLLRIPDSHVPICSLNISKGMSTRHVKYHEKGQTKSSFLYPTPILSKFHFFLHFQHFSKQHHIGIFLDSSHTLYPAINPSASASVCLSQKHIPLNSLHVHHPQGTLTTTSLLKTTPPPGISPFPPAYPLSTEHQNNLLTISVSIPKNSSTNIWGYRKADSKFKCRGKGTEIAKTILRGRIKL